MQSKTVGLLWFAPILISYGVCAVPLNSVATHKGWVPLLKERPLRHPPDCLALANVGTVRNKEKHE